MGHNADAISVLAPPVDSSNSYNQGLTVASVAGIEGEINHMSPGSSKLVQQIETSENVEIMNLMTTVFVWVDSDGNKKCTAVITLPSGISPSNCTACIETADDLAVSQELTVKFKWNERFCDPKTVFVNKENFDTEFYLHPEAQAYESHMRNFRKSKYEVPSAVIEVSLPIPVQSSGDTYTVSFRSFGTGDKIKQTILIVLMTGVQDTYVFEPKSATKGYNSDN